MAVIEIEALNGHYPTICHPIFISLRMHKWALMIIFVNLIFNITLMLITKDPDQG
jgi:hypothetical protein